MKREHDWAIELLETEKLYRLQDSISASSDVVAVILNKNGEPVTHLSQLARYCIAREQSGGASCEPVHRELFRRVMASGKLEIGCCHNSGLAAAGLPVYSGGELVCVWILCQFHHRDDAEPGPPRENEAPVLDYKALELLQSFIGVMTKDMLQLARSTATISDLERQAKHLAYHDRLLGLPNSLSLERDLRDNRAFRHLIVVDIVDLAKINEVYGRECGDALLEAMRDYLAGLVLESGRLYRAETADFGILLEAREEEALRRLAKTIHTRCGDAWDLVVGGQPQSIYVTVGVGVLPVDGEDETVDSLAVAVEHALELARRAGGVFLYNNSESKSFRSRVKLEQSLRRSVKEEMRGFSLAFQPIVDPGVAVWRGVEALCRWRSDEFGEVPPGEFIHIAETSGLIGAIGQWVLEQAVAQVKGWGLDQIDSFVLDVNLSPVQLVDPRLDQKVVEILRRFDYPAGKLCLEVTESNELNFYKQSLHTLWRLSELGVLIALDDFGTGYAAFDSLHKLPVKILKTDRSLISGVEHDGNFTRLFYVMVEMAHASGMKIVAEGVETGEQARILLREGADYFQGFHFSHPLPAGELEKHLQNFRIPSGELAAMGYARIDLSRLSDEEGGYELPPTLYKLLSRCMQVLFTAPDGNAAIDTALAYIGQELGVSRSYVFLRESDGTFSNTHEWCAAGILPEKQNLQHADISGISPAWLEALATDGMLVASDIRMLDEDTYGVLIAQGIKAVVEFPFWQGGELFGFVGFDDCEAVRGWTREEIQMLHILTNIISSTLGRMHLQGKITLQSERMRAMVDHMDAFIYVSDLETGEILFVNNELQRTADTPLVGETCWKALQGKEEPCEFCPIPKLLAAPDESYRWEFYNERVGAHFRISDSIIPWDEGKLAHFEYALNITEVKRYQQRLEQVASLDALTGALNRSGFLAAATFALKDAFMDDQEATLAFIDVDGLKRENDLRGHSAGDSLIRTIVRALRRNIRSSDLLGRHGGDEFVILFQNCAPDHAERSLRAALAELEKLGGGGGEDAVSYSFSYGLVRSTEAAYSVKEDYLDQLINLADMRMLEFKRKNRWSRQK